MPSPPYRLVLEKNDLLPTSGFLHSPRIDPLMHTARAVGVVFDRSIYDGDLEHPILDSFQIDSMIEYLAIQKVVRRDIEAALDEHRVAWSLSNLPRGRAAWKLVRISTLVFDSQHTRRTHTAFTVILGHRRPYSPTRKKDRPWDDGHDRHCVFRNGQLVDLNIEG